MNSRMLQIMCLNLEEFGRNEYIEAQLMTEAEAIRRCLDQVEENGYWDEYCEALHLDMEYIKGVLEAVR